MRITESALRKQIRRIISENAEALRMREADGENVVVISDEGEKYNKIAGILKSYGGAFINVFTRKSKQIGEIRVRVAASFKIKPDGSVIEASWKMAPKSGVKYTELPETTKQEILAELTSVLNKIDFLPDPNQRFSETVAVGEYPLEVNVS
jgi:hypothetical protein